MIKREQFKGVPTEISYFMSTYQRQWIKVEEKFRHCNATVGKIGRYIYLRSYDTIVAFLDLETQTLYDILRTEYGYTATSAQHIAKFRSDYGYDINCVVRTKPVDDGFITVIYY